MPSEMNKPRKLPNKGAAIVRLSTFYARIIAISCRSLVAYLMAYTRILYGIQHRQCVAWHERSGGLLSDATVGRQENGRCTYVDHVRCGSVTTCERQ